MGVLLTRHALSLVRAERELEDPRSGGVVVFLGRVRPDRGKVGTVVALDYESDERMARRHLRRIGAEARRRFGARRIVLHHRLGRLRVGTVSVIVGAAAPHRSAAFEAARFLIERLKSEVPIWKSDRVRTGRRSRGSSVRAARRARAPFRR